MSGQLSPFVLVCVADGLELNCRIVVPMFSAELGGTFIGGLSINIVVCPIMWQERGLSIWRYFS